MTEEVTRASCRPKCNGRRANPRNRAVHSHIEGQAMTNSIEAPGEREAVVQGVCYRQGKPTVEDYDEAIADLTSAKEQLLSASLMGCFVCGDSGHAVQDGCHHDPLVLARNWAAATCVWQCYHCGFVATNHSEARAHFGAGDHEQAVCLETTP